jgi:hypothetical protein
MHAGGPLSRALRTTRVAVPTYRHGSASRVQSFETQSHGLWADRDPTSGPAVLSRAYGSKKMQ